MEPKIKICGITRIDDALYAESLGADALGFIFYPKSPRYITPDSVMEISRSLGPFTARVGVFVDAAPEFIRDTVCTAGLTTVQLHGAEQPEMLDLLHGTPVIKAFRVGETFSLEQLDAYHAQAYLLDTFVKDQHGGTGRTFDWRIAKSAAKDRRIILAGGLHPGNIAEAINSVTPWGVDISSGVEASPGVKDHSKLQRLFDEIHRIRS